MMTAPANSSTGGPRRPSGWAWLAVAVVAVSVAALGALGCWVSFASVETAVRPSFDELAWTVPVGVDLGIGVFTALHLVMTWLGMRTRWLRLVPWTLTGITIYLNVAAETTAIGSVAHGVLPALWVIAIEAGLRPVLATWAGLADGTPTARRGVRVRLGLSRWVLAPWPTLRLWRRLRLLRDIPTDAMNLDRAQDLARAALQDTYGPLKWRWKAPRQQRVLYRHGALTPAHLDAGDTRGVQALSPGRGVSSAGGATSRGRQTTPTKRRSNGNRPEVELPAELVDVGRRVARQLATEGRRLTRDELVTRVRAEGRACPNDKAGALLARLQAELAGAQT